MSIICTDPTARNYNVNDSLPCFYTIRKPSGCFVFKEMTTEATKQDRSFTLSYDMDSKNWVFFHGYIPDFYINGRDKLYSLKNGKLYSHNDGDPGVYYDPTPQPFFIDLVFAGKDSILNTISWVTTTLKNDGKLSEFNTFTHLMAWNSTQCTGYIPLVDLVGNPDTANHRKTMSTFVFNEIHDAVIDRQGEFLSDIFAHYEPIFTPQDVPWYDKALLKDNYFVIRFKHDQQGSKAGERVILHEVDIDKSETSR